MSADPDAASCPSQLNEPANAGALCDVMYSESYCAMDGPLKASTYIGIYTLSQNTNAHHYMNKFAKGDT